MVHVIWNKKAVESPDSAQPYPPHAGSCRSVPLRSCPGARKVSALVADAVEVGVAGEEAGAAGEEAGLAGGVVGPVTGPEELTVLGVPEDEAELVEELQAVNSTAIQASEAQAATCRGLGAVLAWPPPAAGVILMMSKPL